MPKRSKKNAEEEEEEAEAGPLPAKEPRGDPNPAYCPPPPRELTAGGRRWTFKVASWNVDGLRAWVKKGGLEWVKAEAPDVLCLQETKCGAGAVPPEVQALQELPHQYWASTEGKPGYGGVGLLAKEKPLEVTYGIGDPEHDAEGRVVTAEFPSLRVVSAYVPNAGRRLARLPRRLRWDQAFRAYLARLPGPKPLALCGDLNVAHRELDLRHPRANRGSPGFSPQEREGFGRLLEEGGLLDSFRHLYPDHPHAYTFWTYLGGARSRNVGWRLDYGLLSRALAQEALCDSRIHQGAMGSDHCPISLLLAL
ncbi:DNA repair nuclease/redox regulator APEX1 [Melanerpes formicivorus]|uniref:DNA repair nuclease/redox regulator APEX1 n=1 Tax=Melanerpes formicivorus TaxID=211600 RepID=UPI003590200F